MDPPSAIFNITPMPGSGTTKDENQKKMLTLEKMAGVYRRHPDGADQGLMVLRLFRCGTAMNASCER